MRPIPKWLWLVASGTAVMGVAFYFREEIATEASDVWAGLTGKKKAFVQRYSTAYAQTSKRLPLAFLLPQAALESNWGTSRVALQYNNLSGRKGAGDAGSAAGTALEYNEATGKNDKVINDSWAIFSSWAAAIESQFDFLLGPGHRYLNPYLNKQKNKPYGEQAVGLANARTLTEAWRSIASAGYATAKTDKYVNGIVSTAKGLGINPNTLFNV